MEVTQDFQDQKITPPHSKPKELLEQLQLQPSEWPLRRENKGCEGLLLPQFTVEVQYAVYC